jgi:hypothetical protein
MDEKTWQVTIQAGCDDARIVRGGTMCHYGNSRGYCTFENCPRVKDGVRSSSSESSKRTRIETDSCHGKTQHNRIFWQYWFTEMINRLYVGECYLLKVV